jgi:hypothetical protein
MELAYAIAGAMNKPAGPVWELVGMDQMTYFKLPYSQKQMLMRRAGYPIPIKEVEHTVPAFMNWAIPAFKLEHAIRVFEMGEEEAFRSYER